MVLSWSAGGTYTPPLSLWRKVLHVMEKLDTFRIHGVLADLDEQLALAVGAESLDSLSAGGRFSPLSFLDDGRGLAGTGSW